MYNKLFTKILDSSIWLETNPTRIVWITLIAAMDEAGYVTMASVTNLARRANVTLEEAEKAVLVLESPDKFQPNQPNDGRRIERVEGGWMILNAEKYRLMVTRAEALHKNRERVARFRAKKSKSSVMGDVMVRNETVMQSEQSKSEQSITDPPALPSDTEVIYQAYPRREGHKAALKAISAALKTTPKESLLEATKAYAEAIAAWPQGDRQFVPHPATWFNQGRYGDDRTTWIRKQNATDQRPNSRRYSQVDDYSGIGTLGLEAKP